MKYPDPLAKEMEKGAQPDAKWTRLSTQGPKDKKDLGSLSYPLRANDYVPSCAWQSVPGLNDSRIYSTLTYPSNLGRARRPLERWRTADVVIGSRKSGSLPISAGTR